MSWFRGTFGVGQGCTSCRKLVSGWWGFFLQFLRIFLVSKAIKNDDWGLNKKISKQCIFVAGRLEKLFCAKNFDVCHFSREKHKIHVSRRIFWENLLMRTSRKLCNLGVGLHSVLSVHLLCVGLYSKLQHSDLESQAIPQSSMVLVGSPEEGELEMDPRSSPAM